jgi:hypothetical protein
MSSTVREIIERRLSLCGASDYLFPDRYDPTRCLRQFQETFYKAVRRAELLDSDPLKNPLIPAAKTAQTATSRISPSLADSVNPTVDSPVTI